MRRIILGSGIAAALAIAYAASLVRVPVSDAAPVAAAPDQPPKASAGAPSVAADANRPPVPLVRKPVPAAPVPEPQSGSSPQQPEPPPAPAPPAVASTEADPPRQLPWTDVPEALPPGRYAFMPPTVNRDAPPGYVMMALPDGRIVLLAPERRREAAYPAYAYEIRIDRKERHRRRGKHKDWD